MSYDVVMKGKDQLRQWLNVVLMTYSRIHRLVTLRNIGGISWIAKLKLRSLVGVEQVS